MKHTWVFVTPTKPGWYGWRDHADATASAVYLSREFLTGVLNHTSIGEWLGPLDGNISQQIADANIRVTSNP